MLSGVECGKCLDSHSCGSVGVSTRKVGQGSTPLSQSLPGRSLTGGTLAPSQFAHLMGMKRQVTVEVVHSEIPCLAVVKNEVGCNSLNRARVSHLQWSTQTISWSGHLRESQASSAREKSSARSS